MDNCIFCMIAEGKIPSKKIYEDVFCVATLDIGPATKGHTLIIPKSHHQDITDIDDELLGKLFGTARKIGLLQKEKLGADGFNLVQNNGAAAGQTVPHFHIHVIPRYQGGPVIAAWEPGKPSDEELADVLESYLK